MPKKSTPSASPRRRPAARNMAGAAVAVLIAVAMLASALLPVLMGP